MKVRIKKIYQRTVEGETIDSIVSFSKRDYYYMDRKIVQWRYFLVIDLWLIMFRFDWLYPKIKKQL